MTERITVLHSFPEPGGDGTGNPYVALFASSFPAHVRSVFHRPRRCLTGRFDVLHIQWPEQLARGRSTPHAVMNAALGFVLLLRARLHPSRRIVVTVHNLRPHERGGVLERIMLALVERWTDARVFLQDPPPGQSVASYRVPHGHYRQQFAAYPVADPSSGSVLTFGHLRPYKGVERLLDVVGEVDAPNLHLTVAGQPNSSELAADLRLRAAGKPVDLLLTRVDEPDLARLIHQAELVVLPYEDMYNSGALLLALSLATPTLVPRCDVNERLSREVGDGWVLMYDSPLSADDVQQALAVAAAGRRADLPDMSAREWPAIGGRTAEIYAEVLAS